MGELRTLLGSGASAGPVTQNVFLFIILPLKIVQVSESVGFLVGIYYLSARVINEG